MTTPPIFPEPPDRRPLPHTPPDPPSSSEDGRPSRRTVTLAALLGALVGALLVGGAAVALWAGGVFDSDSSATAPAAVETVVTSPAVTSGPTTVAPAPAPTVAPPPAPTVPPGSSLLDASAIGAQVVPSVVTVQVGTATGDGLAPRASGSGVVLDEEGRVVTNDHVVAAGSDYEIVLADGRVYPASLVGTDEATDLAVLAVEATGLQPIRVGETDTLEVGDAAIAVGSPLGLEGGPSLTVGVVSAFGREVQTGLNSVLYGMVQTDAPITQGSSGGALVDGEGRLIGITTAVGVSDVGIEGIGFATPIEIVSRVVSELIADGAASQPFLGITGSTGFGDTADGGRRPTGVDVNEVESGSAAFAAGVEPGDIITALDDRSVDTMDELIALLRRYRSGDSVELRVMRGQSTMVLETTLGNRR